MDKIIDLIFKIVTVIDEIKSRVHGSNTRILHSEVLTINPKLKRNLTSKPLLTNKINMKYST